MECEGEGKAQGAREIKMKNRMRMRMKKKGMEGGRRRGDLYIVSGGPVAWVDCASRGTREGENADDEGQQVARA